MGHGDLFLGPDVIAAQSRAGIGGVGASHMVKKLKAYKERGFLHLRRSRAGPHPLRSAATEGRWGCGVSPVPKGGISLGGAAGAPLIESRNYRRLLRCTLHFRVGSWSDETGAFNSCPQHFQ